MYRCRQMYTLQGRDSYKEELEEKHRIVMYQHHSQTARKYETNNIHYSDAEAIETT